MCVGGGGGWVGVLWHFCIYIGLADLFGFKNLNFDILWGSKKNEYFWGMKICDITTTLGYCRYYAGLLIYLGRWGDH